MTGLHERNFYKRLKLKKNVCEVRKLGLDLDKERNLISR